MNFGFMPPFRERFNAILCEIQRKPLLENCSKFRNDKLSEYKIIFLYLKWFKLTKIVIKIVNKNNTHRIGYKLTFPVIKILLVSR